MQARVSFKEQMVGLARRGALHSIAAQIFIVTMVLMAAALILMSFTLSSLKASRVQSEATEDTLLEITTVDTRLVESDGVLASYVVSKDPWFATRIAADRNDFRTAMKKLGHSVSGDSAMLGMYKVVADRLAKRQALYDYLAQPQHWDEVANVAQSPAARAERGLTGELRDRLWDLLRAERVSRYAQHTAMIREAENSFWIAVGIVLLAIFSGAINLLLADVIARSGTKR